MKFVKASELDLTNKTGEHHGIYNDIEKCRVYVQGGEIVKIRFSNGAQISSDFRDMKKENIKILMDETPDNQEELFQSAKEIIEDNLQNIRTAEQSPLLSTDKCEEIAGFIIHDLKQQFIISKK